MKSRCGGESAQPNPAQIYCAQRSSQVGLQPFSLATRVSPETAKQDKMQVIFDIGEIRGTTREIDGVKEALFKYGQRILTKSNTFGLQRPPQAVRTKGKTKPLFSGCCKFSPYAKSDSRQTSSRISLHLWLNPTRFLLHQPFSPFPDPVQPVAWENAVLFSEMISSEFDGQFSYDGNNNWIPNTKRSAA